MLKVEKLLVEVPIDTLKSLGNLNGGPAFTAFTAFQKHIRYNLKRIVPKLNYQAEKKLEEEIMPYLLSYALIPTPISIMLKNNITFSEAINTASKEIKATMPYVVMACKLPTKDFTNLISTPIVDILEKANAYIESDSTEIEITTISDEMYTSMKDLGIISLVEKIYSSNLSIITETTKYLFDAITKYCSEKFEINTNNKDEFNKIIGEICTDLEKQYFIQSVLSILLTKAISDNITIEEAISAYDEKTLINLILKKITDLDFLRKSINQFCMRLSRYDSYQYLKFIFYNQMS